MQYSKVWSFRTRIIWIQNYQDQVLWDKLLGKDLDSCGNKNNVQSRINTEKICKTLKKILQWFRTRLLSEQEQQNAYKQNFKKWFWMRSTPYKEWHWTRTMSKWEQSQNGIKIGMRITPKWEKNWIGSDI
jgi:hypothetical protein